MRERVVDQRRPQQREQGIRRELETFRIRARDQRRRDDGEHHLISEEQHVRDTVTLAGYQRHVPHERERQAADDAAMVRPERE